MFPNYNSLQNILRKIKKSSNGRQDQKPPTSVFVLKSSIW